MNDQHKVDESNLDDSDIIVENLDEAGDENDTPGENNKNPSNFKKLYKKTKEQDKEIAELKAKLAEKEAKSKEESIMDNATDKESIELRIFWIEHPEAKWKLAKILEISKGHNMDLDMAWNFLKATTPEESKSYDDFEIKGKKSGGSIDYKSISLEESATLPANERKKWREANWWK